jgi:hypothetical protein
LNYVNSGWVVQIIDKPEFKMCLLSSRFSAACFFALVLTGCAFTSKYPTDWPKPSVIETGQCPNLAGRYENQGATAQECHIKTDRGGARHTYSWDCNATLLPNLLPPDKFEQITNPIPSWVELTQPDNGTLVIQYDELPPNDHAIGQIILRKTDGDFTCGDRGLTLSQSGSAIRTERMSDTGTAVRTSFGIMVMGSGWVTNLGRTFQRLPDDSLLMEVTEFSVGAYLFVPTIFSFTKFVRWTSVPTAEEK